MQIIKNFNDVYAHIKLRKSELIERVVSFLGSKHFLLISTLLIAAYAIYNVVAGHAAFDKPPFLWLNLFFSLYGFYTFNLVGILDTTRQNDTHQIDELYHNYEHESYTILNDRIAELEKKLDKIIEIIEK